MTPPSSPAGSAHRTIQRTDLNCEIFPGDSAGLIPIGAENLAESAHWSGGDCPAAVRRADRQLAGDTVTLMLLHLTGVHRPHIGSGEGTFFSCSSGYQLRMANNKPVSPCMGGYSGARPVAAPGHLPHPLCRSGTSTCRRGGWRRTMPHCGCEPTGPDPPPGPNSTKCVSPDGSSPESGWNSSLPAPVTTRGKRRWVPSGPTAPVPQRWPRPPASIRSRHASRDGSPEPVLKRVSAAPRKRCSRAVKVPARGRVLADVRPGPPGPAGDAGVSR